MHKTPIQIQGCRPSPSLSSWWRPPASPPSTRSPPPAARCSPTATSTTSSARPNPSLCSASSIRGRCAKQIDQARGQKPLGLGWRPACGATAIPSTTSRGRSRTSSEAPCAQYRAYFKETSFANAFCRRCIGVQGDPETTCEDDSRASVLLFSETGCRLEVSGSVPEDTGRWTMSALSISTSGQAQV